MAHDGGEPLSNDWAEQSMRAGFRLEKVNALACPKGQAFSCEMTGLPATVQMVTPYITLYYATEEHAHTDWKGIMHKVCPLLGPLRAVPPVIGSEEERARRQYNLQISRVRFVFPVGGASSALGPDFSAPRWPLGRLPHRSRHYPHLPP